MKKLMNLFLAMVMVVSITFIGQAVSSNGNLTANAQTVRVKQQKRGIIRKSYAGGKYVIRRTWTGTKWVSRKVWVGTKWTGKKTMRIFRRTKKAVY